MSVMVTDIADKLSMIDYSAAFTLQGRRRPETEPARRDLLRRYAGGDGVDDLLSLVMEARRLAEDIRQRTGADRSDPLWGEVEGYLHPYLEHSVRVGYVQENIDRVAPVLITQIDAMETELLGLAPRTI